MQPMTGLHTASLNPYSTGSNSNTFKPKASSRWEICLNPYSTGSNSNINGIKYAETKIVLILILLEVTQIF